MYLYRVVYRFIRAGAVYQRLKTEKTVLVRLLTAWRSSGMSVASWAPSPGKCSLPIINQGEVGPLDSPTIDGPSLTWVLTVITCQELKRAMLLLSPEDSSTLYPPSVTYILCSPSCFTCYWTWKSGDRCHVHGLAFIGHLFLAPRMSVGTANECKRKLCWPLHYSLGIIIFRRMTATWWSFSKSFPTKAYVLPSHGCWLSLQLQACEIGLKSPQKAVILNSHGTIAPLPILAGRSALYRICGCAQEHGPFPANSLLGAFQHHEILPAGEGF